MEAIVDTLEQRVSDEEKTVKVAQIMMDTVVDVRVAKGQAIVEVRESCADRRRLHERVNRESARSPAAETTPSQIQEQIVDGVEIT